MRYKYNIRWKTPEELYNMSFEPYDEEIMAAYHSMATFFEGLGVLVERGLIDISLVEDLLSRRAIWFWESMERWWPYIRKRLNDPTQYDHFEKLYDKLKARIQASDA